MTARIIFLLVACISLCKPVFANVTPEQLAGLKPAFIQAYKPAGNSDTLLELPMAFNSADFSVAPLKKWLAGRTVKKVTLYYSVYRLAEKFDQPQLNLQRFKNLQALFPFLFKNSVLEWQIVGQLKGAEAGAAKTLFHGFVIELRPSSTPALMNKELKSI